MMVEEMQQKGEIEQRKADIKTFNKVSANYKRYHFLVRFFVQYFRLKSRQPRQRTGRKWNEGDMNKRSTAQHGGALIINLPENFSKMQVKLLYILQITVRILSGM